jgi:hypothetical protein
MAYVLDDGPWGRCLVVISVSSPSSPQERGRLVLPGVSSAFHVAAQGTKVYVTYVASTPIDWGLLVIDAANPANPRIVGSLNTLYRAGDVAVHGTVVCVADLTAGLRVIDVSVPASPRIVTTVPMNAISVEMDGDLVYVWNDNPSGITAVYLADPDAPQVYPTRPLPFLAPDMAVFGSQVFAAGSADGLLDVDVSWPGYPCLIGQYPVLGHAHAVAAMGSEAGAVVCVATHSGLRVFDTLNPPGQPTLLPLDDPARTVATRGSTAYVVTENYSGDNFHVVDVADPVFPVIQGSCPYAQEKPTAIAVSGDYAYVGVSGLTDPPYRCLTWPTRPRRTWSGMSHSILVTRTRPFTAWRSGAPTCMRPVPALWWCSMSPTRRRRS